MVKFMKKKIVYKFVNDATVKCDNYSQKYFTNN